MLFEENYFLITCGIAVSQKNGFQYSNFNLETKPSAFHIRKTEYHYITVPWSKIYKDKNCTLKADHEMWTTHNALLLCTWVSWVLDIPDILFQHVHTDLASFAKWLKSWLKNSLML